MIFWLFTAHKFHGPQGVGALYVRSPKELLPLLWGGSQEGGLRPGTENVPGIIGMGTAAQVRLNRLKDVQGFMASLRDRFEQSVIAQIPDVEINGDPDMRVCNTTNLLFRDVDGQALVARLDQEGVRCSQSSACTNQRPNLRMYCELWACLRLRRTRVSDLVFPSLIRLKMSMMWLHIWRVCVNNCGGLVGDDCRLLTLTMSIQV